MSPADGPLRMDVLSCLTQLTRLKIFQADGAFTNKSSASYTMNIPGLKSLHMVYYKLEDLTLECPRLVSLTLEKSKISGQLSLEAPLEDFKYKGEFTESWKECLLPAKEAFLSKAC